MVIDNKTNYFHALDDALAKGLWVFLNSTLVDKYFRQMDGNTQVNTTDLRTLRYSTRSQLVSMVDMVDFKDFRQINIDEIVESVIY